MGGLDAPGFVVRPARVLRGRGHWRQAGGQGACGRARGIYSALPRHGSGRGTAAPRSVVRQQLPRQRSPKPVVATSVRCRATMHGAAQAFGRARAIGAAKSVSLKKTYSVRFKISYQKVLKLKKKSSERVRQGRRLI